MIARMWLGVRGPGGALTIFNRNVHLDVRLEPEDTVIVCRGDLTARVDRVEYACDESNHLTALVFFNEWNESGSAEEFQVVSAALTETGWSTK